MAVDLAVTTDLLRQAAETLEDASFIFDEEFSVEAYPLADNALGDSAVGREVVESARRRVLQAVEAAALLAALAADSAEKVRVAATAFDIAESNLLAPPR